MATLQKAIKVGSSVAAVLPKALLKEVGISAGMSISVEHAHGGVLIRPAHKTSDRRVRNEDERVAETALGLIKRYQNALDRLSAQSDNSVWETVIDFRDIDPQGVPATDVLKALRRLHEPNRKVPRRA